MSDTATQMEFGPTRSLPRRWTSDEFVRLANMGFFAPDERLELLEGEIYVKMTQYEPHSRGIYLAQMALIEIFGRRLMVRIQSPLALGETNRPEPDVALVDGEARSFQDTPTTALLVVEIAVSTLSTDRTLKAAIYAQAEIPEYWLVNVAERTLEVHRQPAPMRAKTPPHGYRSIQHLGPGEFISPLCAPDAKIAVNDLLP